MKLYAQADSDANRREKRRQIRRALILALPFFAMAIAAFVLRIELLCIAGFVIAGSILIFLYDLRSLENKFILNMRPHIYLLYQITSQEKQI